jgi:anaerobic magnesium-protoporphyrin IX monomethyl ester cyclase
MKILLIQPNCAEGADKEYQSLQFPLNLGYIASSLIQAGNNVKMIDLNVSPKSELSRVIKEFRPQIIGITAMTSTIINAKEIIMELKAIDSKIITVLGGVHASALPIETMKYIKDLDFLVYGEGEKTIVDLIKAIELKKSFSLIRGIVYKSNNKIIKNPQRSLIENLDTIPYPARDLLPMHLYSKQHVSRGFSRKDMNIIEIMTSRGCPNSCIFCAGHINYGFRVRFRSFENIIGEISECIKKYSITHISIEDDTFTLNRELVIKLCHFLKRNNLTWNCNARVNTVDYELLKLMSFSGCKKITFGIESGNSEILKKIKKGITINQAITAVKSAKKAGIRYVECDFILGSHVDETIDTITDSVKLIYKLMPDFLVVSILCPYPGTEIYDIMIKNNLMDKSPDWSQFTLFGDLKRYKMLKYLDSKQLSLIQKKILKKYYSSPKYILNQIIQIRKVSEMKFFLRMGQSFLKEFF